MPHLEPSYLRYIYDGLEKGELHPDNAASLPEGLTGLYEAAFEENKPARERQKLLETFSIWALLKKEVSAQFVAEILEVPTQNIIDFIATYSNWFTSPESGKYQLYHERLKAYLLQKLSEQEISILHNKLISRLELAIEGQKEDEFELYGLEFLSVHYFTTAMITGDGQKLIALSYNQNHWQRQLKLSKGFDWTKKGLKQVMTWASKFNDEEVIECGLQMVELHHQEQNDAPQIVALVTDGDIDIAFKRIEAFGGNDKEGLQRKFILYMLCLMELTLLESKDKPFRKEAIEKILKHFDENIPVDHSILNWDDFFPSYLMFQMACELSKIEINKRVLYTRCKNDETNYFNQLIINSNFELNIIDDISQIPKCHIIQVIEKLAKKGSFAKALKIIEDNLSNNDLYESILIVSEHMLPLGKFEEVEDLLNRIPHENEAKSLDKILWKKQDLIIELVKELVIQKKIFKQELLKILDDNNKYRLVNFFLNQEIDLLADFKNEEIIQFQKISIKIFETISDKYYQNLALSEIAQNFINYNQIDSALKLINENIYYEDANGILKVAYALKNKNQNNLFNKYFNKAIEIVENNKDSDGYYHSYETLVRSIICQEDYEIALKIANEYKYKRRRYRITFIDKGKEDLIELVLISKSINLAKNQDNDKAIELISGLGLIGYSALANFYILKQKNIQLSIKIFKNYLMNNDDEVAKNLSLLLCDEGQIDDALEIINTIENVYSKNDCLKYIGIYLISNNQYEKGFEILKKCELKKYLLIEIGLILQKQKNTTQLLNYLSLLSDNNQLIVLKDLIDSSNTNLLFDFSIFSKCYIGLIQYDSNINKNNLIETIVDKLLYNNDSRLIKNLIEINDNSFKKAELYIKLININSNQNLKLETSEILIKAMSEVKSASLNNCDYEEIDNLYEKLSLSIFANDKIDDSLRIADLINDEVKIAICYFKLSTLLYERGNVKRSDELIETALNIIDEIDYDPNENDWKYSSFPQIVTELAKQDKIEYALEISKTIPDWGDEDIYRDESILSIIKVLDLTNDYERAIELCSEILFLEIRVEGFLKIIDCLPISELDKKNELINKVLNFCKDGFNYNIERKILYLTKISEKLLSVNKEKQAIKSINESFILAKNIEDLNKKVSSLLLIVNVLKKLNKPLILKEVLNIAMYSAFEINIETTKTDALRKISFELTNIEEWEINQTIISNISNNSVRNECLKNVGNSIFRKYGYLYLNNIKQYFKNESIVEIKKGVINSLNISNIDYCIYIQLLKDPHLDILLKEALYQIYYLNQIFFENLPEEKIQRINRTLNIQWAIDIKNQLPN